MDVKPRYAVSGDRRHFMALLEEFVKTGNSPGMAWGVNTGAFYEGLFEAYVPVMQPRGRLTYVAQGVVVICKDGFSLAGGPLPYDTPWGADGLTACGWGTYCRPGARRKGLAGQMRQLVVARLQELGYAAVIGGTKPGNEGAIESVRQFAWEPIAVQGVTIFAGTYCIRPDPEAQ